MYVLLALTSLIIVSCLTICGAYYLVIKTLKKDLPLIVKYQLAIKVASQNAMPVDIETPVKLKGIPDLVICRKTSELYSDLKSVERYREVLRYIDKTGKETIVTPGSFEYFIKYRDEKKVIDFLKEFKN
jgi:hypothetical protein